MAENLGSIYYDFEVDTSGVLKGERVVGQATDRMQKDFNSLDKSTSRVNTQMTKTAASVKKAGGGMRNVSGIAGQLGFQLQDVAVQAQAGTSAFTIMAQQGSQVASVFGPGGAVIGAIIAVGSALAGALIPAMMESGETVDELREKLIKLMETATLTREQADVLIAGEQDIISEREKSIQTLKDEETSLRSRLALSESTIANYDKESKTYKNLIQGQQQIKRELDQNIASQQLYNAEIEESTKKIDTYNAVVRDQLTPATKEQRDQLNTLIDGLKMQAATFGMTQKGIALYTAEMLGATQADKDFIAQQYDKIEALKQQRKETDEFFKSFDQFQETDRAEQQLNQRVERTVDTVGLTPLEKIQQQYDQEQQLLEEALAAQALTQEEYAQREVQINKEKTDKITAYNKQQMENQKLFSQTQQQMLGALSNVFGTFASTMEVHNKESFEKQKKFSIAQALVNTALAVSQALGSAPPPVSFVLAGLAGAAGAATVAQIRNQEYSGRQYGGPVSSGNMYRVNETGVPEIYSSGGKDYLMGTQNAQITPLDKMGGGNEMKVEVNNYTPYQVYVTQDQAAGIARVEIGNEASKLKKGQGQMAKAMKSSSNYRTNATR